MKTVIINKADLSIATKYDGAPRQHEFGGPWGWADHTAHIQVPEEMDADCVAAEMQGEEVVLVEDAQKVAAKLAASREAKLEQLRKLRDAKLSRADQLINIAFLNSWTAAEKTELKDFRQSLLDITEPFKADMSTLDGLDFNNVSWPVEPSEA